jgi:hypothetical protein
MSRKTLTKEFHSTFELLHFLTEHKLIKSIEIDIQGGMWPYVYRKGSGFDMLSKEDLKQLEEQFYEYAANWKDEHAVHPDFSLPPNIVRYKFLSVAEEKIILNLYTKLTWRLEEMNWDKAYIREYGGKVSGGIASYEEDWGEVAITKTDKYFADTKYYTLEQPQKNRASNT